MKLVKMKKNSDNEIDELPNQDTATEETVLSGGATHSSKLSPGTSTSEKSHNSVDARRLNFGNPSSVGTSDGSCTMDINSLSLGQ